MNGEEYKYLRDKVDKLDDELSAVLLRVERIDSRIAAVWKTLATIGAVAGGIASWFGFSQ